MMALQIMKNAKKAFGSWKVIRKGSIAIAAAFIGWILFSNILTAYEISPDRGNGGSG